MNNNKYFSPEDFKKWMMEQKDSPITKNFVGTEVASKVGLRKLKNLIQPEDGDLEELAECFRNEGGTVSDVDGKIFIIEVSCGMFAIPRNFVSRA